MKGSPAAIGVGSVVSTGEFPKSDPARIP